MNPYDPTKALCWPKRLGKLVRGGIPPPVTVQIDPTNRCSYDCAYCSSRALRRGGENLTAPQMKNIIDQADDLGCQALVLAGGGEPLDNPATADAVMAAADRWLEVGLVTNGYHLGDPAFRAAAVECRWIRISLAASTEGTYKHIHRPPSRATLSRLHDAVRALSADTEIGVSYLVQRNNIPEMARAAKIFAEAGARYVTYRPAYELTPEVEPVQAEDWPKICEQLEDAKETGIEVYGMAQRFNDVFDPAPPEKCLASPLVAVCQADGNMPLCCHKRGDPSFYIGNLLHEPLNEVWGSARHSQIIASVDPSRCLQCRYQRYNKLLGEFASDTMHRRFL